MNSILNVLFNKDTIDAWISVVGTIIGTLLSGIISAMIAVRIFRKQIETEDEQNKKNKEMLKDMIRYHTIAALRALHCLSPESKIPFSLDVLSETYRKLKNANEVLRNIPNDLVFNEINVPFQGIRDKLRAIEEEIYLILTSQIKFEDKIMEEVNKLDIMDTITNIGACLQFYFEKPMPNMIKFEKFKIELKHLIRKCFGIFLPKNKIRKEYYGCSVYISRYYLFCERYAVILKSDFPGRITEIKIDNKLLYGLAHINNLNLYSLNMELYKDRYDNVIRRVIKIEEIPNFVHIDKKSYY